MEHLPSENTNKHEKSPIKDGVDFVFEKNPNLAQIGAKDQYSEYLDTIFPDSVMRMILYRGDNIKFSLPTDNNTGVYLTTNRTTGSQYGDRLTMALVETKNPYHTQDMPGMYWKRIINKSDRLSTHDSIILNGGQELIIAPKKIHLLGSDQDLENFRKFVENHKDS
ncbi:MAG: hypothetical protein RL641_900 [Candidatus Parcubacteria bacterium]|jgi:hypothetical protein